jgi:hypothetical protein
VFLRRLTLLHHTRRRQVRIHLLLRLFLIQFHQHRPQRIRHVIMVIFQEYYIRTDIVTPMLVE